LQLTRYCLTPRTPFLFVFFLLFGSVVWAQSGNGNVKANAPRRISFAEAQKLLGGETEGNLTNQPNKFTRTRLRDGRVLELFYPLTLRASGKRRAATAPGYGMLYESESVLSETSRPRHALEDLIPDGRFFVANVPMLVARLEKRLGGKLDYSRGSLRRLDSLIASYHSSHTTAQTEPQFFQQVTAYYGEVLRRSLNAEWKVRDEKVTATRTHAEPNLIANLNGRAKELRPWSSVLTALANEDVRGVRLSKVFEEDLAAAQ
jgi:hypothetical protein